MDKIKQIVEKELKTDVLSVERLHGGMSNYNYLVETTLGRLVVRVPGENAQKFVNREIEKYHIDLVAGHQINQEVLFTDVESGIKISRYLEGKGLEKVEVKAVDVVNLMRKYHALISEVDYAPFDRINLFESYISNQSNEYFELRKRLNEYQDYLLSQEKVFCHNDAQPLNMIMSNNQLFLLDWEFAGNNDPMYDLVCFTEDFGADPSFSEELITTYFGRYDNDLLKRKLLWTIFQCLQWYNVALFKDNTGMSEKLKVNFLEVCDYFIETSKSNFELLRRMENES